MTPPHPRTPTRPPASSPTPTPAPTVRPAPVPPERGGSPARDESEWSHRHSVQATARRTAALVNALSGENQDPEAVAAVLAEHGEAGPITLSVDDLAEMRAAAALLRQVFAADHVDGAAALLNGLLRESAGAVRLTSHDGLAPWHLHLDSDDDAPWGEWFLASSCMALTVLIWDRQSPPGGLCASPACANVYLTQGSGLPRRYCSRRCATRERVAAHRRRRAAAPPAG